MPPRDWAFRVQDILDAIAKIQRYVSDVDFETFETDEEIMDAVTHNLTVFSLIDSLLGSCCHISLP